MFLSRAMPTYSVIALCRALRHNLDAGLSLVQVFRQQAERGNRGVRPLAGRVLVQLEQGQSLSDSLAAEAGVLPPLLLSLTRVGEETGHLAETFRELERYFSLQDSLRKQFRSQSLMPLIQLCLAFLILAGLIFVLGIIGGQAGTKPMAIFGLSGTRGALLFLAFSFGSMGLAWFMISTIGRAASQRPATDAILLRLPGLGPLLEALILGRFCLALSFTLDSGMTMARALRLSMRATGHAAYGEQAETVTQAVKKGASLVDGLTRSKLFSEDFLSLAAIGEEGGRLPEVMRQQADYWNEEAAHRLKNAMRLAAMLVWLMYAAFMVWAIFSIASIYLGALGL